MEGVAYQTASVEKTGVSELQDLKFGGILNYFLKVIFLELNVFKDKFEKGKLDEESSNKTILDLNIQLKGIKEALEKVKKFAE